MNKDETKEFKVGYDRIFETKVLMEKDSKKKQNMNFSPRSFAQNFFRKLGEGAVEEEREETEFVDEIEKEISFEEKDIPKSVHNKLIFKEGACGDDEEGVFADENSTTLQEEGNSFCPPFPPPRPPQPVPPRPPRPPYEQSPDIIARDIYNIMLVLNILYRDLRNFNTEYSEQFDDMIEELNIITVAMLNIYQTLSRGNRIPIQNQRKPFFNDFCTGVVVTSNYLRSILFDIRRLQRAVNIGSIDRQLIIISFTLQSQQVQLQQMLQDCFSGGNL